jgi:phage shock protein PspC (stress-responsive transcriptional regulator)
MVGGVCGGLGEYLGIDPTLVRLFFILLAVTGSGIGILIYLLLWIILPPEEQVRNATFQDNVRSGSQEIADRTRAMGEDLRGLVRNPNPNASALVGISLIGLGVFYLIDRLNLPWLAWLNFDSLWPFLLIIAGLALIFRRTRGG